MTCPQSPASDKPEMANGGEQTAKTPSERTAARLQPGCGVTLHYLIAIFASLLGIAVLMYVRPQHPSHPDPVSPFAVFLGLASLAVGFARSARESARYRSWLGYGVLTLLAMPALMFPATVYPPGPADWPVPALVALFLILGGWFGRQRWLAFVVIALAVFGIAVTSYLGPSATVPTRDLYLASGLALGAFGGLPALAAIVFDGLGRIRARRDEDNLRLRVLAAGSLFTATFTLITFIASLAAIPNFAEERDRRNVMACVSNLHALAIAMGMYTGDHQGRLPPADSWSDAISSYLTSPSTFVCPAAPQLRSGYAFNRALGGARLSDIADPEHTVLLYESDLGWNGAGGPGTLSWRRGGSSSLVAFADGDFESVNRGRAGGLVWQPGGGIKTKGRATAGATETRPRMGNK